MIDTTFDEMTSREEFLQLIAAGVSEVNAGIQVGWSPRATKAIMRDPEFKELVDFAREQADGTIEEALHAVARKGNVSAIALWLFNRQPDRWRDTKRIEVRSDIRVAVGVVGATKQAALELLREQGVGAVQALGAGEIVDAEVIE